MWFSLMVSSCGKIILLFLNILNFILASSEISDEDNVLEIGPGLGALTEKLFLNTNNLGKGNLLGRPLYKFDMSNSLLFDVINLVNWFPDHGAVLTPLAW